MKTFEEMHKERLAVFSTEEAFTLEGLERHGEWILAKIAEIVKLHSPVFWLYVQRTDRWTSRMFDDEGVKSSWRHVKLCLETMFWKFGDLAFNDVKITPSGKISANVRAEDACMYAGELTALVFESASLPVVYRRLAKGASLKVGRDGHFDATLPGNLNAAGLKYDRRRNDKGRYRLAEKGFAVPTLRFVGSWGAAFGEELIGIKASKWPLLFYQENTLPEGTIEYSSGGFGGFEDPRFMRVSWDLSEWEERFECFSEAISVQTGMTLADFKTGFLGLNALLLAHLNGERGVSCHQLGLLAMPKATFFDELTRSFLKYLPSPSLSGAKALLEKFVAFLECDRTSLETYDLFSVPVPCAISVLRGDTILLDVTQIHLKLQEMMLSLVFDQKMRTSKGATFEAIVGSEIRRHCRSVTFPIPDSQHLFKSGASDPFAQADLYIGKGNLLFIVDCKAYCIDKRYVKGEPQVVRNRWRRVSGWLAESDERARTIAQNPVGANYRIPSECQYVIPVVCSSIAEYIWEDEPMTQLTDLIPRVCTIQELIEVIDDSQKLNLDHKLYAIEIAHASPIPPPANPAVQQT